MSLLQVFVLVPLRGGFACGLYFFLSKFGLEGATWFFFAAAVVVFVPINLQFQLINACKQIFEDWAHMGWTLRERIFATKDLALNACARFGGSAQTRLVKCGGFHHGVERFGVISLPCFVACFDLNVFLLDETCAVIVFAK